MFFAMVIESAAGVTKNPYNSLIGVSRWILCLRKMPKDVSFNPRRCHWFSATLESQIWSRIGHPTTPNGQDTGNIQMQRTGNLFFLVCRADHDILPVYSWGHRVERHTGEEKI